MPRGVADGITNRSGQPTSGSATSAGHDREPKTPDRIANFVSPRQPRQVDTEARRQDLDTDKRAILGVVEDAAVIERDLTRRGS